MNAPQNPNESDSVGLSSDPTLIARIADMLSVPPPEDSEWRAATVVFYATGDESVFAAQLQHVQDLQLHTREHQLLLLARQLINAQLEKGDQA